MCCQREVYTATPRTPAWSTHTRQRSAAPGQSWRGAAVFQPKTSRQLGAAPRRQPAFLTQSTPSGCTSIPGSVSAERRGNRVCTSWQRIRTDAFACCRGSHSYLPSASWKPTSHLGACKDSGAGEPRAFSRTNDLGAVGGACGSPPVVRVRAGFRLDTSLDIDHTWAAHGDACLKDSHGWVLVN